MTRLQLIALGAELYQQCSKITGPFKDELVRVVRGAVEHKAIPLGYHPDGMYGPSYWWLTFGDISPHAQERYIAEHTPPGVRITRFSTNGL